MVRNRRQPGAVSRAMTLIDGTRTSTRRVPGLARLRARRIRSVRFVRALPLVAVAAVALTACNAAGTGPLVIPGTEPLVTVQMRGGMCADGGMCDSTVILDRDGRVHSAAKPPNDLGVVAADRMTALAAAIAATDFAALTSKPFTGECPIAFDGQELIFEFATARGTRRVASCEVDIDWGNPVFVALAAAAGEWIPLPLT